MGWYRKVIFGRDWSDKRRALEAAAKEFADAELATYKENVERYKGEWLVERTRLALIRKIAGIDIKYVDEVAAAVAEIMKKYGQ